MTAPPIDADNLPSQHETHGLDALALACTDADPVPLDQSISDSSLWTDGLPDAQKINNKMEQRHQQFRNKRYPPVTTGRFRYQREIWQRKQAQNEFYADMSYYESLLLTVPVLPLPVPSDSTTITVPYHPAPKKRRGRPPTGGRKKWQRPSKEDEDF